MCVPPPPARIFRELTARKRKVEPRKNIASHLKSLTSWLRILGILFFPPRVLVLRFWILVHVIWRCTDVVHLFLSESSLKRTMRLLTVSTLLLAFFSSGLALQIQCYQCEEMTHDCSTPEFIVNCTVNVQDTCQKEVLVKDGGPHYRKSCASSAACLIASSGYQQFCTGKLNSVCITCCNTPLCNGQKKPPSSAITLNMPQIPVFSLYILLLLCSVLC